MFEVGKKYVYSATPKSVWECVYATIDAVVLQQGVDLMIEDADRKGYTEWHEPVVLTKWLGVVKKPDGEPFISTNIFSEKESLINHYDYDGFYTLVDTIEVKWEKPNV